MLLALNNTVITHCKKAMEKATGKKVTNVMARDFVNFFYKNDLAFALNLFIYKYGIDKKYKL